MTPSDSAEGDVAAPRPVTAVFAGLAVLDVVLRVERAPGPDEKVRAYDQQIAAGGPAANAAVTFAALGGTVSLVTALGEHALAWCAIDDLEDHRVGVVDVLAGRSPVPVVAAITVVEGTGERSVVALPATESDAEPPAHLADLVAAADVVLVDGHHPRIGLAAARAAGAFGIPVVLDAGSWKPVLPELLPSVSLAVCSEAFRAPGATDQEATVAALLASGVRAVAVTAGPAPVRWWTRGRTAAATGSVAVPAVTARDTLGAGDVFHGALAWAWGTERHVALEDGLARWLEFASAVAARRVAVPGPRGWLRDSGVRTLAEGFVQGLPVDAQRASVGLSSAIRPSRPLTKAGDSSVDISAASSTASDSTTASGTSSSQSSS